MPKFNAIAVAGLFVALTASAFVVARYADRTRMRLEQEGSGGGQAWGANLPPSDRPKEIDDFPPPPLRMDADGKLIPVDPEQRRKAELAIWYADVYEMASQAVWMIPLAGLILLLALHVTNRAAAQLGMARENVLLAEGMPPEAAKEGEGHEPATDS